eukprot:3295399-Pleurochrysis_carterae.AAC.1
MADGDGEITHKQKHTVRDSFDEPDALLCYTRRGKLGAPTSALKASRNHARSKMCVVSLQGNCAIPGFDSGFSAQECRYHRFPVLDDVSAAGGTQPD